MGYIFRHRLRRVVTKFKDVQMRAGCDDHLCWGEERKLQSGVLNELVLQLPGKFVRWLKRVSEQAREDRY